MTKRALFFFPILLFFSCGKITSTKSLKLAHGLDVSHPVHKGIEHMAERLEEKSGGKLTLEIGKPLLPFDFRCLWFMQSYLLAGC